MPIEAGQNHRIPRVRGREKCPYRDGCGKRASSSLRPVRLDPVIPYLYLYLYLFNPRGPDPGATTYFSDTPARLKPSITIRGRSPRVSASSSSVWMVRFSPGISAM